MRRLTCWLLALLAGCGTGEPSAAHFVVDTTGGIERVTSDAPNGWPDPTRAWHLRPTQTFGGEEGTEAALINPRSLVLDASGRVYVADVKPTTIKVFGADGTFIRTIGRDGKGPGEFTVAFLAIRGDRLVVHDPETARTSVFDTSGTFLTSWASACCYWERIGIDSAGRIYIPSPDLSQPDGDIPRDRNPWVRYTLDGRVVDTLFSPSRRADRAWTLSAGKGENQMMIATAVPFTPTQSVALHPEGGFVVGWGGGYVIARSPGGMDTSRIIRRAWAPAPIPEARRRAEIENSIRRMSEGGSPFKAADLRSTFKLGDIPSEAPAFTNLAVDPDGNIWAEQLVGSDSTKMTWDLFDRRGVWMGPVTAPSRTAGGYLAWHGHGAVYLTTEDDLGRPVIVRYQLER